LCTLYIGWPSYYVISTSTNAQSCKDDRSRQFHHIF